MTEENKRALYTQIVLPGQRNTEEDAQTYDDRVRKSQNLLNQNFVTIQQQIGEMSAALRALEEWATQFS